MKYYSYYDVVIECRDDVHWKTVVHKMRAAFNKNTFHPVVIMIEDIQEATAEDYIKYLETLK
jgi:hypothetical protein